ncbi:MAG: glutaredoxin family protein [Patescibacteria group bacterium]
MKITLYTIKDCAFSKQEKEYLNTNKLVFEEKDLETNKDFLTEMLAISNNFAGTPVTRVEKDDGTIAVLKGFTKEEFDTTFGLTPTTNPGVQTPNLGVSTNDSTVPPVNDTPIPPVTEVPPTPPVESVTPVAIPTPFDSAQGKPVETPIETTPDPLKSVMDDLQSKVDESLTPVTPVEQPSVPPAPPADPTAPTIPDFPAK